MEMANEIIAQGQADMVAMVRAILADPEIVNKTRRGQAEDVRPCLRCHTCNKLTGAFYPIRCAVNPVLGRELDYAFLPRAEEKKKVVIIGGGPAGIQAAITSSQRGHEVIIFEKDKRLGGNLVLAAGLDIKVDMKRYLKWLVSRAENNPAIEIRLGTEADLKNIKAEKPDVVIVAAGADPVIPSIPGVDKDHVVWVGDVDAGKKEVGETVLVAGGGSTGGETALQLAKDGKKVTIIEMLEYNEVIPGWPRGLMDQLEEFKVPYLTETRLVEITDMGASVIDKESKQQEIPADTVILSLGFKPRTEVVNEFSELNADIHVIGDCVKPRTIKEAIHDGFNIAVEI
jgi:NADPH-dependent 2,4-dienoyl-CoA reductase/sulfur reductase-like enzyme